MDEYLYLGVIFHVKLGFSHTADALSTGGSRALGGLISKLNGLKDFCFKMFQKLYYSCVGPVLDYASPIWDYKSFSKLVSVQSRAIRYFLGVHRFTPNLAIIGDWGLLPCMYWQWISMLRYWNRLILMQDSR